MLLVALNNFFFLSKISMLYNANVVYFCVLRTAWMFVFYWFIKLEEIISHTDKGRYWNWGSSLEDFGHGAEHLVHWRSVVHWLVSAANVVLQNINQNKDIKITLLCFQQSQQVCFPSILYLCVSVHIHMYVQVSVSHHIENSRDTSETAPLAHLSFYYGRGLH